MQNHWFEVFYNFKIASTVAIGTEEIKDASTVDEAVSKARALHPHAKMEITQVTEWKGDRFNKTRF